MKLSGIDAAQVFKSLLIEKGVTTTIYAENKPSSGLPNEYIDIRNNGQITTPLSKMGFVEGTILVMVNIKLLSTGGKNTVKEGLVLGSFDDIFIDNTPITKEGYTFRLTPNSIVYNGGGIYEGYSSKFINITYNKK